MLFLNKDVVIDLCRNLQLKLLLRECREVQAHFDTFSVIFIEGISLADRESVKRKSGGSPVLIEHRGRIIQAQGVLAAFIFIREIDIIFLVG